MKNREGKPVDPAKVEVWENALRNGTNPNIGDTPLESIGNLALKNLGATMVKGWLVASAIRSYTNAVKMVVGSAVNQERDALYPRKCNDSLNDRTVDKNPQPPEFTHDL